MEIWMPKQTGMAIPMQIEILKMTVKLRHWQILTAKSMPKATWMQKELDWLMPMETWMPKALD